MNATAMKTQIAKPTVAAQRAARPARQSVVVRATAEESRRAVLTGFVAGESKILAAAAQAGWAVPVPQRALDACRQHCNEHARVDEVAIA